MSCDKKRIADSEPTCAPIPKRPKKKHTLSLDDFPKSIFDPAEGTQDAVDDQDAADDHLSLKTTPF